MNVFETYQVHKTQANCDDLSSETVESLMLLCVLGCEETKQNAIRELSQRQKRYFLAETAGPFEKTAVEV